MYKQYLKISLVGILVVLGIWLSYNLSQPLVTQTFEQVINESKSRGLSIITDIGKETSSRTLSFKFINNGIVPSITYILCIMLLGSAICKLFLVARNTENRVHRILFIIGIICLTLFISLTGYQAGKVLILTITGGATIIFWYILAIIMCMFIVSGLVSNSKKT